MVSKILTEDIFVQSHTDFVSKIESAKEQVDDLSDIAFPKVEKLSKGKN